MKGTLVLVVSDSLGETAERVARAALSQFQGSQVDIRRYSHVDDVRDLEDIIALALQYRNVVIIFTIIIPEVRRALLERAESLGIPVVDILGPPVQVLERVLMTPARYLPGLSHRLDQEYFERIEAVEFAVRCDDGKDLSALPQANVVLLGVSRTSKTPVSMYLAHQRVKAANLPLVPEVPLPPEVMRIPPERLIGLTADPKLLTHIRTQRLQALGLPPGARYADEERVREELAYAHGLYRELGCRVIDVSNQAVEETAHKVLEMIGW